MKVVFIYRLDASEKVNAGVIEKLWAQSEAFKALGHSPRLIYLSRGNIEIKSVEGTITIPGRSRLLAKVFFFSRIKRKINPTDCDLMIIRYGLSYPSFIRFLSFFRGRHPSLRIAIDFPTFPYSVEWRGIKRPFLGLDRIYRTKLRKYVDRAITTSNSSEIYGIPALHMPNGIWVNRFPARKKKSKENTIQLVAIGKWNFWHGLDRVIQGIAEYQNLRKHIRPVILKVIGDGPARPGLERMVKDNKLGAVIEFITDTDEERKNEIFQKADIAIGTLGMHRKGLDYDSSLKHREYCARGIPFILSAPDYSFPSSLQFVKYEPPTDEPIDIKNLLHHFDSIQEEINTPEEIRHYAVNHLNWEDQIQKLLNSF